MLLHGSVMNLIAYPVGPGLMAETIEEREELIDAAREDTDVRKAPPRLLPGESEREMGSKRSTRTQTTTTFCIRTFEN